MIATTAALALLARSAAYTWPMLSASPPRSGTGRRPLPSPTVIIPAFNEGRVLEAAVAAALAAEPAGVIVVDDGSTDETPAVAARLAERHPSVDAILMDRNGGKAAALNAGIDAAQTDWVVCVDADTLMAPDAVHHLMTAAAGAGVVTVAGHIEVGNPAGALGRAQAIEYAVECERRRLQARLGALTTVPGALGAVHRPTLLRIGGYPEGTLIEDTAVTLRLLEFGQAVYAPQARARTEVPSTLTGWWRQRSRWSAGFLAAQAAERRTGPRLRLLVDEVLAPLLAPWICLAAMVELPLVGAALLVALLGAAVHVEATAALGRRAGPPLDPWAAVPLRIGYAGLTSIHLISVIGRVLLRRPVAWNKLPRIGLG